MIARIVEAVNHPDLANAEVKVLRFHADVRIESERERAGVEACRRIVGEGRALV